MALGRLSHGKRLRLANEADDRFKLLPRQTGAPVFDFEPEPSVKVAGGELKTVPALTAFLADLYMAGRISAEGTLVLCDTARRVGVFAFYVLTIFRLL